MLALAIPPKAWISPGPDTTRHAPGLDSDHQKETTCELESTTAAAHIILFSISGSLPPCYVSNSRCCIARLLVTGSFVRYKYYIAMVFSHRLCSWWETQTQQLYRLFVAHSDIFDPCSLSSHGHFNDRNTNYPKHVFDFLHRERGV